MTKIIGHRGARGVALENSLASVRAALAMDADAIEFDIHRTADGELVVLHDDTTARVAKQNVRVQDTTLSDLRAVELKNGQHIPTLKEVLTLVAARPVYIDIKDEGSAQILVDLLEQFPNIDATFVSFHASELRKIRTLCSDAPTYLYFLKAKSIPPRPIGMVRTAVSVRATGIGLDKLLLNPLTYFAARRAGLRVYTYSIGTATLARFFRLLYPAIDFCTSHPERLRRVFRALP